MKKIKTHPMKVYSVKRGLFRNIKEWMWTIVAKNGNTIDTSTESYKNKLDCEYNALSTAYSIFEYFEISPVEILVQALHKDQTEGSYYHSWKANIAMSITDALERENLIKPNLKQKVRETINQGADEFLQLLINTPKDESETN